MNRAFVGRVWMVFSVTALAFAFVANDAAARSAVCSKLERQLASAGGRASGGNAKFQNAARAQAQQLQIARGQARRAGCGGSFTVFGDNNNLSCARLTATIRKMESNLAKLQNKAGSAGGNDLSKARIRAALDANDCFSRTIEISAKKRPLPQPVAPARPGLLTQIFGGATIEPRAPDRRTLEQKRREERRLAAPIASAKIMEIAPSRSVKVINGTDNSFEEFRVGGTFRTLCVRTCDGYYFPASFSTTSSHFAADEKSCSALCPGAETKLYYHSIPDQEPEQMVSLAKEPYMSLPTAFKYRVDGIKGTPGCTCQAQTQASAGELSNPDSTQKKVRWIALPTSRPDLLNDPEAAANRAGALDSAAVANLIEGKASTSTSDSDRKIRVVGPAFLPAQSRAEVLPVPGRVTVQ